MKFKRILLLWLIALPFLHGCGFDESLESSQQKDGDDFNVIQDIGPQALDKVFQWASNATPIVTSTPTPSTSTNTSKTSSIVVQTTTPVNWKDNADTEND